MMPSLKRIHDRPRAFSSPGSGYCPASSTSPQSAASSSQSSSSSSTSTLIWTPSISGLLGIIKYSAILLVISAWILFVWDAPLPEFGLPRQWSGHMQLPLQPPLKLLLQRLGYHRRQQDDQQPYPLHPPHQPAAAGFQCFDPSLPNITIYATGGTIAGSASSADQTTGYQVGTLGIQSLIGAVPQLCSVSNVRGVQIANEDSINVNSSVLVMLAQQIQEDLDRDDTQGVVVTHGTDTMEETAFFLDLTVKSEKAVVVTGAMRPASAISADGPMNLLSSVLLAGSHNARGRGAMIVLNDRIGSARFTTKSNANHLDSFRASDEGFLGVFENVQPVFFYPPSRPLGHHHFDISKTSPSEPLPQVDVLYGHQEFNTALFQSAVDLGAKGIVLAGLGAGFWPSAATEEIKKTLAETDIPVVVSRRPAWGFVGRPEIGLGIGGGFLNPQKARIQLQLSLQTGLDSDAIKSIFEHTGVH